MTTNTQTKTVLRLFFVFDDEREEAWLAAMTRQGWHLVEVGLLRYRFRKGEATEARYRIDFQDKKVDLQEYLGIYKDAGWEPVTHGKGRYYFRAALDAATPDIFSDEESRQAKRQRQFQRLAGLYVILLVMSMFGNRVLFNQAASDWVRLPMVFVALAVSFLLLWVACSWLRLSITIKKGHR